jgi:hypothetical protein
MTILLLLYLKPQLSAALLINEFTTGAGGDWVELTLSGPAQEKMDISGLFVTMYYGTNEPLSKDPVTIYSYDRPETPYNDQYVVVHLTEPEKADETDLTGDTNGNGCIDIYCNNYFGSLWNTEGVVAIDTDDDPSNGGILDFVYYSNRDQSPNESILSYVASAQKLGQWQVYAAENIQACAVFMGSGGLSSYQSICRNSNSETNAAGDFSVSNIQTPGGPNITVPIIMGKRLFKPLRKKITMIPGHLFFGSGEIPVFVFIPCVFKLRIFSITGIVIHESPLYPSAKPGLFNLLWNPLLQHKRPPTGLYLCKIEAVNPSLKLSEEEIIYIIVSYYR